ncbi:protein of unknown function [Burkholderia multivorans]
MSGLLPRRGRGGGLTDSAAGSPTRAGRHVF